MPPPELWPQWPMVLHWIPPNQQGNKLLFDEPAHSSQRHGFAPTDKPFVGADFDEDGIARIFHVTRATRFPGQATLQVIGLDIRDFHEPSRHSITARLGRNSSAY